MDQVIEVVKNAIETSPPVPSTGTHARHCRRPRPKRIASTKLEQKKMTSNSLPKGYEWPQLRARYAQKGDHHKIRKEGEIVTGKSRSHQARGRSRIKFPTETEEPYYAMSITARRSEDLWRSFRSLEDEPLQHSGAEVPAVQNNVDNQHKADDRRTKSRYTKPLSRRFR